MHIMEFCRFEESLENDRPHARAEHHYGGREPGTGEGQKELN